MEDATLTLCVLKSAKTGELRYKLLEPRAAIIGAALELDMDRVFWEVVGFVGADEA